MTDATETIKVSALCREFETADVEIRKDESGPMRMKFSASSEFPVSRFFGDEILDHSPGAMRMDRIKRGAVPLLFNHNIDDPIGMVDTMGLVNGRSIVDAHFFEDHDRASQVQKMVRGGLRNVSLMYRLHKIEERNDGSFLVREWEPMEVSIVTVPADPTVGLGRSDDAHEFEVRILRAETTPAAAAAEILPNKEVTIVTVEDNGAVPVPAAQDSATIERLRIQTIQKLADQHKVDAAQRDAWVNEGVSVDEVGRRILDVLAERSKQAPQAQVGMSKKELRDYSIMRAVRAIADKSWKNAGLELEAHKAVAAKLQRDTDENSILIPFDVLQREVAKRDLTVASVGAGGYLVETENVGFIELMRNRSVAFSMGARRLSGLVGNVTVPKQSVAGTAYWLASESTDITESTQTFVQMSLSPKTVGAYTEISRQLLLQSSPDAESLVTTDLATIVALAADLAVLDGAGGSGEPQGIIGTDGVGSVTGTTIDYAKLLEFLTDTAGANLLASTSGFVTTPAVAAILKQRVKYSSTASPFWEGRLSDGIVEGYRAMSSNQVPSAHLIFGDFSQVVVAEWGVLELAVNPQANFKAGIIGIRAMYSMDVGVRYPAAFSVSTSTT